MAGNKINTKTKGKEDKSKSNKSLVQNNEDNEEVDFSLLRKPICTSITGFAQARKIFDLATEELKGLISNECDLLYECKVCRNIFRSLANFISHKRVYCTEQFNTSLHGQFFKTSSATNEIMKIKRLEEKYFESLKDKDKIEILPISEADNRIPLTKDLTTIIEKIVKSKGVQENATDDQQIVFQKIPNSSVAMFQNIDNANEKLDNMGTQVKELDIILSRDKAVLQSDGKFKIQSSIPCETDNIIQISDDEDNDSSKVLKCKICDLNFSTIKTLKFHMKHKHLESRLVYSCPDCLEIFSTSWSVYRHLFKVHRKTAAQIRRLRESIQAKAFKMNNPPAFYERRKNMKPPTTQKISEEERLDQENQYFQAWMDNVEGDSDVPRCFGCGRTFERRAALAAHTHTCQPRSRALARRPPETKKIEIQIRKDYNKGPVPSLNVPLKTAESNENKAAENKAAENKTAENKAAENKAAENKAAENKTAENKAAENKSSEELPSAIKPSQDVDEVKATKKMLENVLKETAMDISETLEKPDDSPEKPSESQTPILSEAIKPVYKLPFAQHIEKNNLASFRQKVQPDIEVSKLLCKKCDIQHDTVKELYNHMASHYKWMRYACKLCNFKHYDLEKLPEHVKIVHRLKGDNDFFYSTVKAIDGNEALELSECLDETTDINGASPESRRPSRCSSDSSRLSDDSSSSSTRAESGTRKRKLYQSKGSAKRKREIVTNDDDEDQKSEDVEREANNVMDNDSSSTIKTFEENSSDIDDIDDKISKRHSIENFSSVASRRPVRKKTKPKNEDFEYDLSNLLKMEAQGYRDSQAVTTKSNQTKKKPNALDTSNFYEIVNRDCSGALATLSKKAVEKFTAQIKNTNFIQSNITKESKPPNIFVRPMLPKTFTRGDKSSPKKDPVKETEDNSNSQKEIKVNKPVSEDSTNQNLEKDVTPSPPETSESTKEKEGTISPKTVTNPNPSIPAVVPIKFRRQSLELIKNPLINKNITDFKKAGMKTKILVIKPINRNKDGTIVQKSLKFQTIKFKNPSKCSTSKGESTSDQVMVVEMPNVDCVIAPPNLDKKTVDYETSTSTVRDTTSSTETSTQPSNTKAINNNTDKDDKPDEMDKVDGMINSEDKNNSASNDSELVSVTEQKSNVSDNKLQTIDSEIIEAAT